jgi:hypothetical protein
MIAHFPLPFGATDAIGAGQSIFARFGVGEESRAVLVFRPLSRL